MKEKQFAVIGIGRFGESLTKELTRMGHEVLAIDVDEEKVNDAVDFATHAVQADTMDDQVLKTLGIRNFDAVIVAIGDNIQSNILTTIVLKELGVKKVISKAKNAMHGKVLEKIGADIVIYPERDVAIKLARSLVSQNFVEQINLSPDYSIIEFYTPLLFANKSLTAANLRQKFGVTILAIRRGDNIIVAPGPNENMRQGDILVALGHNDDLQKLSELD
ncbi:MAG: potassium uptake system protein [Firmicutes bacterium HGW-Firmicutes-15]|nr:MAG: potassium uptake system protein [Firmicutes bacterium HGW-Firmicutes-15]